ncbi:MAG: DUF4184 family protein [Gammaproteobacteria bacterium]|nr:MAG: DUF4184 family protein [Gammaproteobacteria bacterium]
MPFTLAHPAAILPLRGLRYLRTAPLIIGAMIPDLPYYVPARFGHFGPETHSLTGSFTTCLVFGYAALGCVFLLRRPLTALLSARARWLCLTALAPFRRRPLEWALAGVSIILGVWTHLLWDSFTHNDGWMVRRVAALSAPLSFDWYSGTVCHVLQYLSSAFGLAAMALWYRRLPAPAAVPAGPGALRSSVGPVLMLVAAAAILIGGVQATQAFIHAPLIYRTLDIFLTRSLAWFAVLYLVAGTVVTLEQEHDAASGMHG